MKKKNIALITLCLWISGNLAAKEYHVSPQGSDADAGTLTQPFRTINRAAQLALPGDTVTVHEGVYREWVNPLYGGESNDKRILYRAAPGEKAELKGSEVITGWKSDKRAKGVWRAVVSNKMFGNYNPFNDELFGDWLWKPEGTTFHTGEVYLNDVSLYEAQNIEKVLHPDTIRTIRDPQGSTAFWYAEVGAEETTIYANFGAANPNKETVEITVRPTCFYPTREGLNYITFRGFHVSQAATQWAAPTAEQVGMVSTHWCKGWIIEENIIRNSRANGITLGKERGSGHNLDCTDKRLDGTHHYIEVIFNVLRHGWEKIRSVHISYGTTRFPIANKPESAAAWEVHSVKSTATTFTISCANNNTVELKWQALNSTELLIPTFTTTEFINAVAMAFGWTGWLREQEYPPIFSTTTVGTIFSQKCNTVR